MNDFDIVILHGAPSLYYKGIGLLRDFSLRASLTHGGELPLPLREVRKEEGKIVLDYSLLPFEEVLLTIEEEKGLLVMSIKASLSSFSKSFSSYFDARRTIVLTYFPFEEGGDFASLRFDEDRACLATSFPSSYKEVPLRSERLLLRHGDGVSGLFALPGTLECSLGKNEVVVSSGRECLTSIEGSFLALGRAKGVSALVASFEDLTAVPLSAMIKAPAYRLAYSPYEFYQDRYEEKDILKRVDELIEGGILLDAVILRGSFFQEEKGALADFELDPSRFPSGLKGLASALHARRLSLHVRVPLSGGSRFFSPTGDIARELGSHFEALPGGNLLIKPEQEAVAAVFSACLSFLASSGVDGLEVEGLSLLPRYYAGLLPSESLVDLFLKGLFPSLSLFKGGAAFAASSSKEARRFLGLPLVYDGHTSLTREKGFEESASELLLSASSLKGHPLVGPSVVPLGADALEGMVLSLLLDSPLVLSGPSGSGDLPFIKAFLRNGAPYGRAEGLPSLAASDLWSNALLENRAIKVISQAKGGYLFASFSKCPSPLKRELRYEDFPFDGEYLAIPSLGGQPSFFLLGVSLPYEVKKSQPVLYELIKLEDGACRVVNKSNLLRYEAAAPLKRFLK